MFKHKVPIAAVCLVSLLLSACGAAPAAVPAPEMDLPIPYEPYDGVMYHIFFHALIAFPEISYAGGRSPLDEDCVTAAEFKRCLEQLHANGYALIDINETFEPGPDGRIRQKTVFVPEGKKPLILSVDDMVYDPSKMGLGMVDKLILDDRGRLASYTDLGGSGKVISYDNEILPILESFISLHPDFSIRGARGMLAMTGFAGIFGYRTDRLSPNRASEMEEAKKIVAAVKKLGWTFGCHGYGHRDAAAISEWLLEDDTRKWRSEVENLVGATPIYVYPYGHYVAEHGPKYNILLKNGFRVMCGVSHRQIWEEQGDALFMTRLAIDGYSLRNYGEYLAPLIDCASVIDRQYRQ
jgi:hypothetical protein